MLAQQARRCAQLLQDLVPTALAPSLGGTHAVLQLLRGSLADCTAATRDAGTCTVSQDPLAPGGFIANYLW